MSDILVLITARGGSKAIPRKNIAPLGGRPLLAWTIDAARGSGRLADVVVSTDDDQIAAVARECGADVPFMRPPELSRDDSPHIPVLIHATRWVEQNRDWRPDYVLLLQPTSPFRTARHIEEAIQLAREKKADSVVSVCEAFTHPYLTKRIASDGRLENFVTPPEGYLRRQALPPAYALNGAISLIRRTVLLEKQTLYPERTYAYVMSPAESMDIDTEWDLYLANLIMKDKSAHEIGADS